MAYKQRSSNSRVIMATLSGMTGLVISLWVFDNIFDAVAPSLYTCASGFATNATYASLDTSTALCYNITNVSHTASATAGYFGTTIGFIDDLLPVVGIIAGYILIRMAIKRMS